MSTYGKQRITFARWERDFRPIYLGSNYSWCGYGMHNFRDRWKSDCLPALEENRLWSCLINDDHWCIAPGNHIVNRDTCIITLLPYTPDIEDLYVPY